MTDGHAIASAINSTAGSTFGDVPSVLSVISSAFTAGGKRWQPGPSGMPAKRRRTIKAKHVRAMRALVRRVHKRRRTSSRRRFKRRANTTTSRSGYGKSRRPRYIGSAISIPRAIAPSPIRKFVILGTGAINCGVGKTNQEAGTDKASQYPTDAKSWEHLPHGWAEATALYEKYRVIGAKLTVSVIGATISDAEQLWGVQTLSERAVLDHFLDTKQTRHLLEAGLLPNAILLAGAKRTTGLKSLNTTWSAKKWWPKGTDMDAQYAALTPLASPPIIATVPTLSLKPLMMVWYGGLHPTIDPPNRQFQYKLELIVHFRKPVPFVQVAP